MTGGREKRLGVGAAGAGDGRSREEGEKGGVEGVMSAALISAEGLSFADSAPGGPSTIEGRSAVLHSFAGVAAGGDRSHCFASFFSTKEIRRMISNAISPNAI